jgi:tetratricopeptide (TPR) repeat protein
VDQRTKKEAYMRRTGLSIGLFFLLFAVLGCTAYDIAQIHQNAGDVAYKKGDYKSAIDNYKNAVDQDLNPSLSAWRYEKLGDAYFKIGNYKNAIDTYKQCLERTYISEFWDKYPNYRGKIASNIVASYEKLRDLDSAVLYMEQLIAKDPNNYNYFRELGYRCAMIGQYDKAIAANKRAIELSPRDAGTHNTLGFIYGKRKQYDEAFKAFRKSIELNPKNDAAYSNYGLFLAEKGDYEKAAEQYKKAIELQPSKINYLLHIANIYKLVGKYDDAMTFVNKAIELQTISGIGIGVAIESDYPTVKNVIETGSAKKADVQVGDKIIKVDKKATKGWNIKQVVQNIKGASGTPVALTIERKSVSKPVEKLIVRKTIHGKNAATSFGLRGFIHRYKGEKEEFLIDAKKAYSLDSTNDWAIISLGASYLDTGKYDESVKMLSQVKEGQLPRILEATAYAKQGDFKKAVEVYSAIPKEELSPKNVSLWSNRAAFLKAMKPFIASKMESAGRLKSQGRQIEALNDLGDALKVADDKTSKEICGSIYRIMSMDPRLSELPEVARKYALRGDVLTEEGKFEGAVKEYHQAIQTAPYIAKLYFNTAMIHGELKKYPKAVRYMKTYLNLAPEAPNARATKDQIYKWEFVMEKGK